MITAVVDPWTVPAVESAGLAFFGPVSATGAGVGVSAGGGLLVGGLEWLGFRVFDPQVRGFLAVDPLEPVVGAGWAGNPYSFAGNDPVGLVDPWGLSPVSPGELKAYNEAHPTGLAKVGKFASDAWHSTTDFVKKNWQYIAAGAVIVAGVALCATGVGAIGGSVLIGAALSAGVETGSQLVENGGDFPKLDPKAIATQTFIGGASSFVGGGMASVIGKAAGGVVQNVGSRVMSMGGRLEGIGAEGRSMGQAAQAVGGFFERGGTGAVSRAGAGLGKLGLYSERGGDWAASKGAALMSRGQGMLSYGERLASPAFRREMIGGKMIESAFGGAAENTLAYANSQGKKSPGGYLRAAGTGLSVGAMSPKLSQFTHQKLTAGVGGALESRGVDMTSNFGKVALKATGTTNDRVHNFVSNGIMSSTSADSNADLLQHARKEGVKGMVKEQGKQLLEPTEWRLNRP